MEPPILAKLFFVGLNLLITLFIGPRLLILHLEPPGLLGLLLLLSQNFIVHAALSKVYHQQVVWQHCADLRAHAVSQIWMYALILTTTTLDMLVVWIRRKTPVVLTLAAGTKLKTTQKKGQLLVRQQELHEPSPTMFL
ncbi:hypothetical protein LTR09_006354 [Extremus antarcticus]|uniref:Uncharacterized protein n=1 Tax=Extremus antarcticus TaxID=702011 RepID=A0AAJ0GBT3_9PEZI|nr:hypothetical protein LTR09_006354 [Extremus antarcticus]